MIVFQDDLSLRRNIELTPRAIKPSDISTKWEEQSSSVIPLCLIFRIVFLIRFDLVRR